MSVIAFSERELVAFARGSYEQNDLSRARTAKQIRALLVANREAYHTTYGPDDLPPLKSWRKIEGMLCDDAGETLPALFLVGQASFYLYNLVSNGGRDYTTRDNVSWLLRVIASRVRDRRPSASSAHHAVRLYDFVRARLVCEYRSWTEVMADARADPNSYNAVRSAAKFIVEYDTALSLVEKTSAPPPDAYGLVVASLIADRNTPKPNFGFEYSVEVVAALHNQLIDHTGKDHATLEILCYLLMALRSFR